MNRERIIIGIAILLLTSFKVMAQTDSSSSAKYSKTIALPVLFYTPDTRLGFGAGVAHFFRVGEDTVTRLSSARFLATYTQNKQYDFRILHDVFLKDDKVVFKGDIRLRRFPDKFYGIGNESKEGDLEKYDYKRFIFQGQAVRKFDKHIFIGGEYRLQHYFDMEFESGGLLESNPIMGKQGGTSSGLGFVAKYDSRQSVFYSTKARFAAFSAFVFKPFLGSDYNYELLDFTYIEYLKVFPKAKEDFVLALQVRGVFNFGDVSFIDMSTAGRESILRGYAANRFRDQHFVGFQSEFRYPIWRFIRGVAFAGVGDVYDNTRQISSNTLKYSFGAGLRLIIDPKEQLSIRFDMAFGRDSNAFYLSVGEAF